MRFLVLDMYPNGPVDNEGRAEVTHMSSRLTIYLVIIQNKILALWIFFIFENYTVQR